MLSVDTPFIQLSMAQGEVIDESYRNNISTKSEQKEQSMYGMKMTSLNSTGADYPFGDPFEQAEEERIRRKNSSAS